ncbi:MAG: FGGY-family carbohydrate kinase [Chloroflexota bacterium]|nr:FGGY-family carbohydrate kinase [Chloroflexota bacterium]
MRADTILVIDAGTSGMRAVAVTATGEVEVVASVPWRMLVPEDAAPFGREFHPADVASTLGTLLAAAETKRDRIAGIAVTGQREGIALLDESGEALFASPNIDARASAEGIAIDAEHADEVYAVTGHLPSLMQVPAKLAWLRQHRPAIAERVRHVLPLVDWIATLLGSGPAISRSLAAENGLLDVRSGEGASDFLIRLDVPSALIAKIVPDGSTAGEVKDGGIAGLPVVLAGADTQCALVGMGAIDPPAVGLAAGWSAPLQMVTDGPVFDCERRTWTSVHVVSARPILESNAGEAGRAWEWICSIMALSPEEAMALAATAPPGSHDAMAVLGARAMRASEMTAGVGALTLPLPLVMSAPDRGDVLRSVLEAAAYAVRANLEQLEVVSGVRVERLHVGGGMSRTTMFPQMIADVIDRPVSLARSPHTSAAGAAILASIAVGLHPSIESATAEMAAPRRTLVPELTASVEYEDGYARWCALTDAIASLGAQF